MSETKPLNTEFTLEDNPHLGEIYLRTMAHTDRPIGEYVRYLGISPERLIGKLVLDLGSGTHRKFARDAEKIGVQVVSVDPVSPKMRLNHGDVSITAFEAYTIQAQADIAAGKLVRAAAQELPLPDDTFDEAFSVFAVPYWLPKIDYDTHVTKSLTETVRVLKPGGGARLYPVTPIANPKRIGGGFVPEETVDLLTSAGCEVSMPRTSQPKSNGTGFWHRLIIKKAA